MRVVVIGGGWSGCAAAIEAKKMGASVALLERTDMLLGTGLVGGIMRNNGRYTAAEEMIALGGGDLFNICDENSRHRNIDFPGHKHASLYDIAKTHGSVLRYIEKLGIEVHFKTRISNIKFEEGLINSVEDDKKNTYEGDVFIDSTGTSGPTANCVKYGNGCAMCIIRCPSFGGRVSLTSLLGIKEYAGKRVNGEIGAMSGSCKIFKESLSEEIQSKLNKEGVIIIPIPEELKEDHLSMKACQQYALKEFKDNIVLLDTGHAKLMMPFYDLDKLRKISGFENIRYEDPYAAGKGNSMRFFSIAPRDNFLKVKGVNNLFCCGEKAGLLVGHTEAIVTGTLAGYNSMLYLKGKPLLELPRDIAVGDIISYVGEEMNKEEGLSRKYTFAGSVYFERMKNLNLYITNKDEIKVKIKKLGLENVFSKN